jgi:hypothetical protein
MDQALRYVDNIDAKIKPTRRTVPKGSKMLRFFGRR